MPRPRLTVEQRRISQARRRQLDAARKRRRRMDINYRQNEQQANTEARRKARQVSRTHYRKVNGRRHLQADVMPTIFDYPEYLLSQCSVIRMANNQQTLIGSSQDFFPLADHSIFGECSGAPSKQVVDDCSRSLLRSCKLVPKLQTSKKIRKSDDHGAEGVDRVPTVNTDCRNMDSESPSSLEENESEKKRDVAVEESDTSVCSVEMSAGVEKENFLKFLHL
ncbi:uncharacterized protein LOC110832714 isoform X2 [Zootermopsis nevadensis]|uniref:uncharacterized protein LOC110832714 isoform X2 n=1 Tax=Zootermopsis nevadensis TaxID=136037 RepID=UPI000B8E37FA|nr:uncharacterized protein LOC110832714 isoform X2 [Zootermopsis nevadensis]